MKSKLIMTLVGVAGAAVVGAGGFYLANKSPAKQNLSSAQTNSAVTKRNPAFASAMNSEDETPNIKILQSIPLVDGLENKSSDEDSVAAELIKIFKFFADKNKAPDGSLHRGTHAKGSCFNGKFEIMSADELQANFHVPQEMVTRLKKGFFDHDGAFPAVIRFANADGLGRIQSDKVPDVRGFSFSVQTPEQITDYTQAHRQDFMMNSTPEFASGGIHEFLELVKVVDDATYHSTEVPNPIYLPAVIKDAKLGAAGNNQGGGIESYATEEYWDNLPYTHGPAGQNRDIVKFKTTPCDLQGSVHLPSGTPESPDYLQKDIAERANDGKVCFLFQIQFFDIEKLRPAHTDWTVVDWVENGGLLWDEKDMPFYTVAKIEIPAHSEPISCDNQYINTRLHSNPENQPIGSIARVRTLVEEVSRSRRMKN